MSNNYYVYVHRRASDNKPFYVGKGKDRRAYQETPRSEYWNNVRQKHGFVVEIVFDNLSEEDAFRIEKDTILEFRYFGYPLVNLTDGGEGVSGYRYSGKKLERLVSHIKEQSFKQSDKTIHTFYHLSGEIFTGTRIELSKHTGIGVNNIAKLFQTKNKRNTVKNWGLEPIAINVVPKKKLTRPYKAGIKTDNNIYTFYHVLGQTFTGTRREFSDYSEIAMLTIAGLFCKNPRRSVFGWALKPIPIESYTHLKIKN